MKLVTVDEGGWFDADAATYWPEPSGTLYRTENGNWVLEEPSGRIWINSREATQWLINSGCPPEKIIEVIGLVELPSEFHPERDRMLRFR